VPRVLVYGASGYTGALVARRAAERGLDLLLAGRREAPLAALGRELDRAHATFALDDVTALDAAVSSCDVVLHCAGPFVHTWRPMAAACLRARRAYVDITGEPPVFDALAALDASARSAGIVLLPGAGFDVVPADTLAAHLARRLRSASQIAIGMRGFGTISRGTARTALESLAAMRPSLRAGVRAARRRGPPRTRMFSFHGRERAAVLLPSADAASMRRSTGVADCAYYMVAPRAVRLALPLLTAAAPFAPMLRITALREAAVRLLTRGAAGPTAEERARGTVELVGEAEDATGARVATRLTVPHGYALTALSAVEIAERLLVAAPPPGFHTPSSAFGPDLLLGLPGVFRQDVTAGEGGGAVTSAARE
jgi:short subunit dehydrogenase-like uncharacterized protein